MAHVTSVLDSADAATTALILQLQFYDLANSENDVGAQTTEGLKNDQAIARSLQEGEFRQYQLSRNIEIPSIDNDIEHTLANAQPKLPRVKCNACLDYFDNDHIYQVHDQHSYCGGCLEDLFKSSMTDKTLYPPRCCQHIIPLEDVERFMNHEVALDFKAKKEELDDSRPSYCCVPTCSTYIGDRSKQGNTGVCPACTAETCLLCKEEAHEGDCPTNDALQQTLDLAKKEGWKACPGCDKLVELEEGCNHMTCRCKTEFCYACRVIWKNCRCPRFEYAQLLRLARQIAERDGMDVDDVMAHLVVNHECINHRWEWQHGGARCETCQDDLPTFIFRCARCLEQICRRCRENRS